MNKKILFFGFLSAYILTPIKSVFAHEAYVMPREDFWKGLSEPANIDLLSSLQSPENINITLAFTSGVILLYLLNLIFRLTSIGKLVHKKIEKLAPLGPFIVRASIALSFFLSALAMSFLGPELPISELPYPGFFQISLIILSLLFGIGLFTEVAALWALVIFGFAVSIFGSYMFAHTNYLGEILVLLFFGMRSFSLDRKIFGPLGTTRKHLEHFETSIVRIFYGFSLIYAAISIKLLNPEITLKVVNDWNLTQFHWLFPSDPMLLVLGAGLAELVIGILIIIGFELRLTVLISLFYLTLSLFYFQEMVWPHLILYGISFNLLIQPEVFTLDHFIFSHHRSSKKWWKRPFLPHTKTGKSIRHERIFGK